MYYRIKYSCLICTILIIFGNINFKKQQINENVLKDEIAIYVTNHEMPYFM